MPVVAVALLLAGCSDAPTSSEGDAETVTLVTDPSQGRMDATAGAHLHDYWGSSARKLVLEATQAVGYLSFSPGAGPAVSFVPAAGDVVPQGASAVEVTMTWRPDPEAGGANQVAGTRLAVRTAADREAQDVGPIASGQTVTFNSTNERNDLPHQVLSAWEFHWVLEPVQAGGVTGVASFQGEVDLRVEAIRGLEIPLYPGHPDQWLGRTEIALFTAEGTAVMDGDPRTGDIRCYGPCPPRMVPGDGVVIPIDAHHVRVTLDRDTASPTRFGLAYHTAVSRDWQVARPLEETPTSRIYSIDVLDGGDGAYAKQSNWEFTLFVEQPVENGYIADSYVVSATVHKDP